MAGLQPAGAICEIVSQRTRAHGQTDELRIFAGRHGLALISIADLIEYRRKHEKHVRRVEVCIPDPAAVPGVTPTSRPRLGSPGPVFGDIAGPENDGQNVLVDCTRY